MGGKHKATTRAGRKADVGKRPRGGAREGGGRKPVMEEAMALYHQATNAVGLGDERTKEILTKLKKEGFRIPAGASDGTKELVAWAREELVKIVLNPTRHAQAQTQILKMFLEEACGKVAENHNVEQAVTVKIVKSEKPAALDEAPAAPVLPFPIVSRTTEN